MVLIPAPTAPSSTCLHVGVCALVVVVCVCVCGGVGVPEVIVGFGMTSPLFHLSSLWRLSYSVVRRAVGNIEHLFYSEAWQVKKQSVQVCMCVYAPVRDIGPSLERRS